MTELEFKIFKKLYVNNKISLDDIREKIDKLLKVKITLCNKEHDKNVYESNFKQLLKIISLIENDITQPVYNRTGLWDIEHFLGFMFTDWFYDSDKLESVEKYRQWVVSLIQLLNSETKYLRPQIYTYSIINIIDLLNKLHNKNFTVDQIIKHQKLNNHKNTIYDRYFINLDIKDASGNNDCIILKLLKGELINDSNN